MKVKIDYGQKAELVKETRLKNTKGKTVTFNSMITAVNYMAKDGWVLDQTYTVVENDINMYHYLMKKVVE